MNYLQALRLGFIYGAANLPSPFRFEYRARFIQRMNIQDPESLILSNIRISMHQQERCSYRHHGDDLTNLCMMIRTAKNLRRVGRGFEIIGS